MKVKFIRWGIKFIILLYFVYFFTLNLYTQTILIVSNRNNISQFEVNSYLNNNFVICAISNGNVNTNITARIYIYSKTKGSSGEYTLDATTVSITPEYGWEEEGSSRHYGHTWLVKGKCVLKKVTDSEAEDVRIFVTDARENIEIMPSTYFDVSFIPFSSPYVGKIVINEVNYDTGYIWEKEWVEFYNTTSQTLDMNNFNLKAPPDKNNFITPLKTLPPNTTTIPPYGYLILVANLDYFTNFFYWVTPGKGKYTNVVVVEKDDPTKSFRLDDPSSGFYNHTYLSGDSMVLIDSSGNRIERLDYKHSWKPEIDDISLERRDPSSDVNSGNNWGGCIDVRGCTPGEENSIALKKEEPPNIEEINYLYISKTAFNPEKENIKIYYKVNNSSFIKICIYNSEGVLFDEILNKSVSSGSDSIDFDGKDRNGNYLSAGLYLIYMEIIDSENNTIKKISKPVIIKYW